VFKFFDYFALPARHYQVKRLVAVIICVAINLASGPAIARKPDNVTEAEMATIPRYCPYAQSWNYNINGPETKRWVSVLGETFHAIHHYCWAQINLQRSFRIGTSEQERRGLLGLVRNDYFYVIDNAKPGFVLLPEVWSRLGEVEVRLSKIKEANQSFANARKIKPDYWPAYSHWVEYLIRTGNKAEAKSLVKTGLEYSPDSRVLREQFRLLGGDPSTIKPIKKQEIKDEPAAKPSLTDDNSNSPSNSSVEEKKEESKE
jgi:tetratricopeptide (TPR) repeat protein